MNKQTIVPVTSSGLLRCEAQWTAHRRQDRKSKTEEGKRVGEVTLSSFAAIIQSLLVFYDEIFITVLLETARALVIALKSLYILFYDKTHYYPLFLNQFPWNLISALSNSIAHDLKLQRMAQLACLVFADMLHLH